MERRPGQQGPVWRITKLLPPLLQKILARTSRYPEDLSKTISDIRNNVATDFLLPPIIDVVTSQEEASAHMATLLTSLAQHYDQMVDALHESEAGTIFEPSEIEGELPDLCTLALLLR